MKRLFFVLVMVLLVGVTYAGIEKFDVEGRMKGYVSAIYVCSISTAIDLGNILQDSKDLAIDHGSYLDTVDKTKLTGLEALVIDGKNSLDAIRDYIETNWPAIGEK